MNKTAKFSTNRAQKNTNAINDSIVSNETKYCKCGAEIDPNIYQCEYCYEKQCELEDLDRRYDSYYDNDFDDDYDFGFEEYYDYGDFLYDEWEMDD